MSEVAVEEKEWKKNKGGRPRVPLDEKLRHRVVVRLSDFELATLHSLAGEDTKLYTQTLRALLNNKHLPASRVPPINIKVHAQLGKIGSNLNQIAKGINTFGIVDEDILSAELALLSQVLSDIQRDLMGLQEGFDDWQDC